MADTSIGKAYVQIVPTAKGIQGDMENLLSNGAESSGVSAGKAFGGKLLGTLGKIGIAAGVAKIFKDSIDAGANLQQSYGGLDTIYGDASEAAKEYAEQAYKAGISANDYAEQAVSFGASLKQAFGGDTSKAVEAANTAIMDMTDNAAKMGTPIENIQNAYQGFAKQNYTMLDNLKLGYGGTKEEMERLLSDAQKLSGQEYDISTLGDVYDAIHVIQEDLGLTGVAAQEASETFSGSFQAMQSAATNLLGKLSLGEDVSAELQNLGSTVITFVTGNLLPMISNVVQQIPTVIAALPGFLAEAIPQAIPVIADMVAGLAQGVIDNIPVFVSGIGQLLVAAWNAIMDIDWSAAGKVVVDLLEAAWNALVDIATGIWDTIVGIFTGDIELPSLTEVAHAAWDGLTTAAEYIWTTVKTWFTKTFDFPDLTKLAYEAWNGLVTLAGTIWDSIVNFFTSTFDFPSLDELAHAAWDSLTGIAQGIWDGITGIFSGALSIAGISEETATQAWDTLTTVAGNIWQGVKDIFSSFEIEWPDFGELAKGALDGLKSAAEGVWNWIKGLFSGKSDDEAVKSVQGSTDEMVAALADAKLQISEVDVSSIQTANEFVKGMVLAWQRMFGGMKNWMVFPTPKTDNLSSAAQVIVSWVDVYKKKMNFSWRLPTLHGTLPVISVNMKQASSGDGKTKVSYPELSVNSFKWFAEGGIFSDPTVIGIGDSKVPEAAVPLDMMWKQMSREFDEHLGNGAQVTNYITVNGAEDPAMYAETLARELKQQMRMRVS